ncbi:Fibroblast growth factor 3 [Stylosanthes scabra]|uniref:Fibroblast growth factor 3 n=1 Tax=Stylosanthes scabra TaxID=79078 RepID=A0ABU6X6N3_9FABA|nr:Fibroblast growth factor 3 [Stylosanthes scabra]
MEGGPPEADKSAFRECLALSWNSPYVLHLALSAGIGGFLFGYDTGVTSGALLYIRDDFKQVERETWMQKTSNPIRRCPLLMRLHNNGSGTQRSSGDCGESLCRVGVGMASMTAPLYISEAAPTKVRGALVSLNSFLITGGQFLSYVINLAFTRVKGTWRWMLGVASVPATLQFLLMLTLPESPRWLYRKGKEEKGREILSKIYAAEEVEGEIQVLRQSIEVEMREVELSGKITLPKMLKIKAVRRGLYVTPGRRLDHQS